MLFSLGLYFDGFNCQNEYRHVFYRREALQASELSFLVPNNHINLRELTYFIHHHIITNAGLFLLDLVSRKSEQKGRKIFHAFFLIVMNTASLVVGEMGSIGRISSQFQVSLNSHNIIAAVLIKIYVRRGA